MTPRERILNAVAFQPTDRLPKDLGGMLSTGISAFAYPKLVEALGLPPRLPRLYDTGQMLAMPDLDVLDALGCDCVVVTYGTTNAIEQPGSWHPYDFDGRLPALVRNPDAYETQPDGSILQNGRSRMVSASYVFDEEHGGQPLDLMGELPMYDLKAYKQALDHLVIRDEDIVALRDLCRRVRESTDRAVFLSEGSLSPNISIHAHGGMAVFPMLCLTEPDYVHELHEISTEHTLGNIRRLLPEIAPYVDVDHGRRRRLGHAERHHRRAQGLPPAVSPLSQTYQRRVPRPGAAGENLPALVRRDLRADRRHRRVRFDILNPVQWPAGGHSYREWKDKARKRIALWGGGVNSQITLPLGSVADVVKETTEVVDYMKRDGGYVFCNIHNILTEIEPEKVIAMYRAAAEA